MYGNAPGLKEAEQVRLAQTAAWFSFALVLRRVLLAFVVPSNILKL
jgi:hypothetical protein